MHVSIILSFNMNYREIPDELSAVNAYENNTFISTANRRPEQATDFTCRPSFPVLRQRGYNFQPVEVQDREPIINDLPSTPVHYSSTSCRIV